MLAPPIYMTIFRRNIHSFHFFYITGFLAGAGLGMVAASAHGLKPGVILLLSLLSCLSFFIVAMIEKRICQAENIVYYHHEIGILVVSTLTLIALRVNVLSYLDITILCISLFNMISRFGCLFVGCCHGRPSKFGIRYGHQHTKQGFPSYYENIVLFPVPLAESLSVGVIIVYCLYYMSRPQYVPGEILMIHFSVYGLIRFLLEFFRGDPERPYWLGVSEAQWTTAGILAVSLTAASLGYLPLHAWHVWLAGLILGMLISRILVYQFDPVCRLASPRQIRELANILATVGKRVPHPKGINHSSGSLQVFETGMGLVLSVSKTRGETGEAYCYTISLNSGHRPMSFRIAKQIAGWICVLENHTDRDWQAIENTRGIFHLIWTTQSLSL